MRSPCWSNVDYPVTQPWLPPAPPARPNWIHCGIDIGCPSGTIIYAARAGVVETVVTGIVGLLVAGLERVRDLYVHGYPLVSRGEHVAEGQPVIHSDTVAADHRYPPTGPHLHFEVQLGFSLPGAPPLEPGRPLDPVPVLLGVAAMTHSQKRAAVRLAYLSALGREPESDAVLEQWADQIADDGSNVDAIITEIADSIEGQKHLAAVRAAIAATHTKHTTQSTTSSS